VCLVIHVSPGARPISLQFKKMMPKHCDCILKNKRKSQLDIIEKDLKKIMIVNSHELKCKIMKLKKKLVKKI